MSHRPFFWLHVKKSAGMTTRRLLSPYYVEVDRRRRPKTFIQASPAEYNDILNNFRVVLGDYQFRRCLFAREFLYPGRWDDLYSFAFAREPVDRCVSMFYYLYWPRRSGLRAVQRAVLRSLKARRPVVREAQAFDLFLELVERTRASDSSFQPLGLHFATHTAPMWDDVTDRDGRLLLTDVFRLEALVKGVNHAFEVCGIAKRVGADEVVLNRNEGRGRYHPSRRQRARIERLFGRDFELYEAARR